VIWRQKIEATGAVELLPTEQALIVTGPSAPIEARSLADGRVLWTAKQATPVTPARVGSLLFAAEGQSLSAIAIDTGARVWTLPFDEPIAHVAAAGDWVIAVAAASIRCLQAKDGRQIWIKGIDEPTPLRPALDATRVYFAPAPSWLAAADLASGVERWRVPVEIAADDITIGRDRLFVRGYEPTVMGFSWVLFTPLVKTQTRGVFSLNARTGWVDWLLRPAIMIGKPAVDDNRVYLALLDNTVLSLDSRGARRWRRDLPDRAFTGPRVLGETVFVPLVSGEVAAIDRQSGTLTKRDPAALEIRPFQAFAASADARWVFAVMTDFGSSRTLSALRRR